MELTRFSGQFVVLVPDVLTLPHFLDGSALEIRCF
jgi:hypothetical protein